MTTDYKILAQVELGELALDNSTVKEQLVYEVPSNTQFTNSSTSIVNTGNSTETYSIAVVPNSDKSTAVTNIDYQSLMGKFVSVSIQSGQSAYSINGINWTSGGHLSTNGYIKSIAHGEGKYVAVSTNESFYSTDGITWTATNIPTLDGGQYEEVLYTNGKFVAITSNSYQFSYSEDGISWSIVNLPFQYFRNMAYGAGKWIITTANQYIGYWYSVDLNNWIRFYPPEGNWHEIIYADNKFVILEESYSNQYTSRVAYSADGTNWSLTSIPQNNIDWRYISYGNGKFVAIGYSDFSQDHFSAYSTDGINWNLGSNVGYNVYDLTYGNGKFVFVSAYNPSYGPTNVSGYSIDGVTWTLTTMPREAAWVGVAYGENVPTTVQQEILQSLNKHKIIYNKQILAGETHIISGGVTLNSGDQIRAKSTSSDIIVNVYGAELS